MKLVQVPWVINSKKKNRSEAIIVHDCLKIIDNLLKDNVSNQVKKKSSLSLSTLSVFVLCCVCVCFSVSFV